MPLTPPAPGFRDAVLGELPRDLGDYLNGHIADAIEKLHKQAVEEAVKPIWEVLHRHYPAIAGRVIGLDQLGETVAHERWAALARDFYDAEIAADALLSADKPKCQRCGGTEWIPEVLGIIEGHPCPDCELPATEEGR
jgi:hypothetical protein